MPSMHRKLVVTQNATLTISAMVSGVVDAQQDEQEQPPAPAPAVTNASIYESLFAPPPPPSDEWQAWQPPWLPCGSSYFDFRSCTPAQVVEAMASGQSDAPVLIQAANITAIQDYLQLQYWGCSAMVELSHDATNRAALVDAGGVATATAAMAILDVDCCGNYRPPNKCCSRNLQQQCQWALNAVDPPMYSLAAYLCLLVAAVGCAVAHRRWNTGLPACTELGWLAALLLDLGAGAVLLTWIVAIDDGEAANHNFGSRLGILVWVVMYCAYNSCSAMSVFLSIWTDRSAIRYLLAGAGLTSAALFFAILNDVTPTFILLCAVAWVVEMSASAIFVAWSKAHKGSVFACCKLNDRGMAISCVGRFCCCTAGISGGAVVWIVSCIGTWTMIGSIGSGNMAARTSVDIGCALVVVAGCIFMRDGRATMAAEMSGELHDTITFDQQPLQQLQHKEPAREAETVDANDNVP
jgi:hypothetical protein